MALSKRMFIINGIERALYFDPDKDSLGSVLRRYGLTGLKIGCNCGQCGTCTIILDGEPVRSCVRKVQNIPEYSRIETIEGIGTANNMHPIQRAFIRHGAIQCGFCTPGFIMSTKALLDKNPNCTRQEARDWFTKHKNLCRCTGYKQIIDAVMAAATVMRGEKPIEWLDTFEGDGDRVYNSHQARPDSYAKAMGLADYGDDINKKLPDDVLHIAVKFPEYHHAKIISLDTSEAEKMPGVVKVLTVDDVEGTNDMGGPIGHPRSELKYDHIYALHGPGMKIKRAGDAIAIVVANTEEEARAAVPKIKVEYEPLPVYKNALEACVPDAIRIIEECNNVYVYQPLIYGDDPEDIFEKAEKDPDVKVVHWSFHSPHQPHLALEPDTGLAFYDEDGELTCVFRTQWMAQIIKAVTQVVGVESVRVIEPPTGASFGAAARCDAAVWCAIATHNLKRPTMMTQTYGEKQIVTGKRGSNFSNYKAAVSKDGKILACKFDAAQTGGGYSGSVIGNLYKGVRFVMNSYNVPSVWGIEKGVVANNAYATAYRGAGSPEMYTGSEQMVDIMAEAIGMDPYEFRYNNLVKEGDLTRHKTRYKVYSQREMFDTFRPKYEEALKWKSEPATPGWKRGVGVSFGGYHVANPNDVSEVALELMPGNKITNYNSWEAQGQGATVGALVHTVEALKPLNIKAEDVRLVMNDTKMCPMTGLAGASRSHWMAGNAIILAANQLLDAMRKEDGTYRTYDEMIAENIPTYYKGSYTLVPKEYKQISPDDGSGDPIPDQNYMLNIARVEVEEATGKVKVVSMHNLADVGVVGNYLALDGQAYSGCAHAIGYALSEHYSDEDKKCLTPLGCGFPECNDIPDDFTIDYLQTPREEGPFGSGGASECFESCSHVCVLNAINNAVGVRVGEMPVTPDKVKAAMEAKAAGTYGPPEPYYLGIPVDDVLQDIIANPVAGGIKDDVEGPTE